MFHENLIPGIMWIVYTLVLLTFTCVDAFPFSGVQLQIGRAGLLPLHSQNAPSQNMEVDYSVLCPALKNPAKIKSAERQSLPGPVAKTSSQNVESVFSQSVLEKYLEEAVSRGHCGAAVRALEFLHQNSSAALTSENASILPVRIYGNVISACIEQGNWVAGVRAFSLYAGCVGKKGVNQGVVMLLASGLADLGQSEKAVTLLKSFLASPTMLEEKMFNIVLSRSADHGQVDLVEDVCTLMESLGLARSCYTYALKIKAYGRADPPQKKKIDEALQEIQTEGINPDLVLMNSVVDAYVRCGSVSRAERVLKAMRRSVPGQESIRPNARTYNTIIKGLGQKGNRSSLQSAFALVTVMEEEGIDVNEVTLNTLVNSCVKANLFHDAYRLLTAYTSTSGSVEAYTSLLNGFAKQGDKEKAISVLKLMMKRGVSPNIFTYTALIDACAKAEDLTSARNLLNFLGIKGQTDPSFAPGVVTFNCYLTGLCRCTSEEHMQEALSILKQMQRQGVKPDQTTYNIIIQGLLSFQHPRIPEAETVLRGMKKVGLTPSQVTYTILMRAYSRVGELQKVQEIWEEMPRSKASRPDVIALNSYIDACIKNGDMKLAIVALESSQTGKTKIRPNLITYSTIIVALARSSNLFAGGKAIGLYREMRSNYKIKPDRLLVDSVLKACCNIRTRRAGLDISFGKEIIEDLESLGWAESEIEQRRKLLRSFVPTLSEVWKRDEEIKQMADSKSTSNSQNTDEVTAIPSALENIFEKHGWNKIDSGFNALF